MRVAVVDVGTNSTRLLVADVEGSRVREIDCQAAVTQLGRGVDHTGQLCSEAIEDVCSAIAGYQQRYEELGVERVEAIATSAAREAHNGDAFVAELRERFAINARVLSGEEEAHLTYLGATSERLVSETTLVCDIGGGSTELVIGEGREVGFHTSIQAGVVRHTERHLIGDPPDPASMENLAADIRHLIEDALASEPDARASHAIAVAGTATSLGAIDQELEPYDSERVHGHRLSLGRIQRMLSRLSCRPLAERLHVPGLHPRRAPTIVAGTVILVEVMRAFGLEEVEVSEQDILHGAALTSSLAAA